MTEKVAQKVKTLPAIQETWFQSLGWKEPLEEEIATLSSILAWRIANRQRSLTVHEVAKSRTGLS